MNLPKLFINLTAVVFLLYGAVFSFMPETMTGWVTGSALDTPSALIDVRATYGGMTLAVGVILLMFARNADLHRLGLISICLLMLCMAIARTAGIIINGSPTTLMIVYLALEVVVAAVAFVLLKRN